MPIVDLHVFGPHLEALPMWDPQLRWDLENIGFIIAWGWLETVKQK
jgi:hypothetical protein